MRSTKSGVGVFILASPLGDANKVDEADALTLTATVVRAREVI